MSWLDSGETSMFSKYQLLGFWRPVSDSSDFWQQNKKSFIFETFLPFGCHLVVHCFSAPSLWVDFSEELLIKKMTVYNFANPRHPEIELMCLLYLCDSIFLCKLSIKISCSFPASSLKTHTFQVLFKFSFSWKEGGCEVANRWAEWVLHTFMISWYFII